MKKGEERIKEIILFQGKDGSIAFRGDREHETIWATQKQIAELFSVKTPAINKHIKNILEEGELDRSTISILEIVQQEGVRFVRRKVEHYNLDMIISIGYRVNSKTATQFRIWATSVLKQHLTKGYTINKKRIKENSEHLLRAIETLEHLLPERRKLSPKELLSLVKHFSKTWISLEAYDEGKLPEQGTTQRKVQIKAQELYDAVADLKKKLIRKGNATELFAQEKKEGALEGILGNVMQSAFGKEMYPSVEEKAAHLLYFIVKNHPFNDGNKRTGAFAFVWFLQRSGFVFRTKITPEALTALTLLVAESKPKEKERMVGLILLLLGK